MQCEAGLGIREIEHSCVSQVVAKCLQIVWSPAADLLSPLFCCPALHIHCLARSLSGCSFPRKL